MKPFVAPEEAVCRAGPGHRQYRQMLEALLCEGAGSRNELPESDRTKTPRPRERFTNAVAELQGPKD